MYIDIYWRRIIHLHELSVRRLILRGINSGDNFTWFFSLRKGRDKKTCGQCVSGHVVRASF